MIKLLIFTGLINHSYVCIWIKAIGDILFYERNLASVRFRFRLKNTSVWMGTIVHVRVT